MPKDKKSSTNAIRIRNLTRNVKSDHIEEIFSSFGKTQKVVFPIDKDVKIPLGYAIVEYKSSDEAKKALHAMDGGQIDGKEVSVSFVVKKSQDDRRKQGERPRERRRRRSISPRRRMRSRSPRARRRERRRTPPKRERREEKVEPKYKKGKTKRRSYSSTSSDI